MRAPRWYIGPTAMPRAAVTPIAPERSEGAIGCDSRPRHCRRDDIPAWRPNKITLLSLLPLDLMMYHRLISFMRAVQSREGCWFNPRSVCKSRWCRQILSRLRADLRENPTKQWASRDAFIQSAGSISNSARYHCDANIALGPILKMYIPGQIRIFNALNSDGYSTGNAPPSGNNEPYKISYGYFGEYIAPRSYKNKKEQHTWVCTTRLRQIDLFWISLRLYCIIGVQFKSHHWPS